MSAVLDACALIAFLRDEDGADVVEELLLQDPPFCLVHAINMCEVFYDFLKSHDESAARQAIQDVSDVGVEIREDMDAEFWREAGRLKVRHTVSLADAFAIALARRLDAELVSSDHHEFDPIAAQGVVKIKFIR